MKVTAVEVAAFSQILYDIVVLFWHFFKLSM